MPQYFWKIKILIIKQSIINNLNYHILFEVIKRKARVDLVRLYGQKQLFICVAQYFASKQISFIVHFE